MVIPFCGCVFGALLYDFFIYTGPESPLNRPSLGLQDLAVWLRLVRGGRRKEEKYEV